MSLRSALMSLKSAGKNGKNVFISGIGIRGRLIRNNRHTSHIYLFSHTSQPGLQARQGEREKESSESLFIQHFAFLKYTTVIARRDIKNYNQ